jgi:hypothetical protein
MTDVDMSWAAFDQQRGTKPRQKTTQPIKPNAMGPVDPNTLLSAQAHAQIAAIQRAGGMPATGNLDPATIAWVKTHFNTSGTGNGPSVQQQKASAAKAAAASKRAAAAQKKAASALKTQQNQHAAAVKKLKAQHARQLAKVKAAGKRAQAIQLRGAKQRASAQNSYRTPAVSKHAKAAVTTTTSKSANPGPAIKLPSGKGYVQLTSLYEGTDL